jgi:hypothetical protein
VAGEEVVAAGLAADEEDEDAEVAAKAAKAKSPRTIRGIKFPPSCAPDIERCTLTLARIKDLVFIDLGFHVGMSRRGARFSSLRRSRGHSLLASRCTVPSYTVRLFRGRQHKSHLGHIYIY